MQFNIISISMNPSIDVSLWVSKIDFEEPVKCIKEKLYPGGKAINVAKVLNELGIRNKIIGIAFENNFKSLSSLLDEYKLHYDFIIEKGSIRENTTITLDDGKIFKINRSGNNVEDSTVDQLKKLILSNVSEIKNNILIFSGSIPPNVSVSKYKKFIMTLNTENNKIIIDNDIFCLSDIKKLKPFIIKPNYIEICKIAGEKSLDIKNIIEIGKELSFYVDHVLISIGKDGLLYVSKDKHYIANVPNVEVKSTVGAGDTTLAGFVYGLCNNFDLQDCIKFSAACGTASVTLDGTSCIKKHNALKYIEKIKII